MITARSNGSFGIKNKPFKVLICIVALVAFLFNTVSYDLAWAARTPSELPVGGSDRAGGSSLFKELNVDTFSLPEYLGHIKDSWSAVSIPRRGLPSDNSLARGESPQKMVIHIQDAHCNYAAQHKIAEIIEYLNKEYDVNTINLEGGAKDYDLSVFTKIYDKSIRGKVTDYFVKEGLVNGAESFAINNPEKSTLWGIEDTKLYIDNLSVYRESLRHKDEVDKHFNTLTHILSNLKIKIYSQELLDFDTKYSQYKSGSLEFKTYLSYLIEMAKEKAIDVKFFKNIYLLNQTLMAEGTIEFKKANNQRNDLIGRLQKRLSKNEIEEFVLKTIEFKSERMPQKNFYDYLISKAKSINLGLNEFPELQKYIVYISVYNATDKIAVMDEVESLENKIKEALYRTDDEKELSKLSKNLALTKNLFNISLTPDDYKYYKANESSFGITNYTSFINRQAPLYHITAKLDEDIANFDTYRMDAVRFYECSFKRDAAFIKNFKFQVKTTSRKIHNTILITGGFHTNNLYDMFRKQGISYISIMPNFKNETNYNCPYFKLIAGRRENPIIKKLNNVLSSTIAAPDPFTGLVNDVRAKFGDEYTDIKKLELEIAWQEARERNLGLAVMMNGQFVTAISPNTDQSLILPKMWNDMSLEQRQQFMVVDAGQSLPDTSKPIPKMSRGKTLSTSGLFKNCIKIALILLACLEGYFLISHIPSKPANITMTISQIESLKEKINNPAFEKKERIAALNTIVKVSRYTKSLELARWLVKGYVTEYYRAKLNVDLSKGDSYSEFLMALVNNETLSLDLRIYAFGLQPTEAIDIKRMSVLGKKLMNEEKNTPPASLLVSDSIWINEKLKTYLLATFSVICRELKENEAPLNNEQVIAPIIDKIMSQTTLLENIASPSTETVILGDASFRFNRTAITNPSFSRIGAGVLFGVFAHEIGHRILGYSINDVASMYGQESPTKEFCAELCSYSFFEAMDWKGDARILGEIAKQQHAEIFKKGEKYGTGLESRDATSLALATIAEMSRYFDKARIRYPDRKIPSLCDVFVFSLKYCAGHKLSPDQKVFENLIREIMAEYEVPSKSISEETSPLREQEKSLVIIPRWGLIGKLLNSEGNIVTSFNVRQKADGMAILIQHEGETLAEVPLAVDVAVDKNTVLSRLTHFFGSRKENLHPHTKEMITQLIDKIKGVTVVVPLEHHKDVKGAFCETNGQYTLYLNKGILNNILGLIHELGEGVITLPKGYKNLTRHMAMRGAGKDVRNAFNAVGPARASEARSAGELIKMLEQVMKKETFAMSNNRSRDSPITKSEKDLIRLNFKNELKGKEAIFGVQDFLSIEGNAKFTQDIRNLNKDLRQGVLNIFLMRSRIDTKSAETAIGREMSRKLEKNLGVNTHMVYFEDKDNLAEQLARAIDYAISKENKDKLPKIFVDCLTHDDWTAVNTFKDVKRQEYPNIDSMIAVGRDFVEGEAPKELPDEVKVILVGSAMMNDRRLKDDFKMSPEDLLEGRKHILNFLASNKIIDEVTIADDQVDAFFNDLWKGIKGLLITRINWKEFQDWKNGQDEVLRAL